MKNLLPLTREEFERFKPNYIYVQYSDLEILNWDVAEDYDWIYIALYKEAWLPAYGAASFSDFSTDDHRYPTETPIKLFVNYKYKCLLRELL